MNKIIFSPEYSGNVYIKPTNGASVMMDTVVVNTIGLVNMLELRLGLYYEEVSEHERLARYYDAVSRYMAENPSNVMAASFNVSSLATAKSMLQWRDELRSAGWNFGGGDISARLAVLVGVESLFKSGGTDFAERISIVTNKVATSGINFSDMEITLPCENDILRPDIKALIEALESHGAKVTVATQAPASGNNLSKVREMIASNQQDKVTLDNNDDSILIYKFNDERSACEYLSFFDFEDVDVWVNADNKQMDSWLTLMGKPKTGSVTAGCTPQLTQLFVMGLSMFANPLNVNTLIEWLNMPAHPMPRYFRSVLADRIVREGGFRNDACKKIVDGFIEGAYEYLTDEEKALPEAEQNAIRAKGKKTRSRLVATFLPKMQSSEDIATEEVRKFVLELESWARLQVHQLNSNPANLQRVEQLATVADMCSAFTILLGTISTEAIDYRTIDSWMNTVYVMNSYTNAVAEKGCRIVVDSPAKIASVAPATIWMGVDGDASCAQQCAFLYPSEKKLLIERGCITPWAEDAQNKYHETMLMTPLRNTSSKLILVVRENVGGAIALKHPLIVRLKQQIENIADFIVSPYIGEEHRHDVERFYNVGAPKLLQIQHADKIKWPSQLSPTTIGTLVDYPLDYVMEHLLHISDDGTAKMGDVKPTMGNVAHAVIEQLFSPRDGKRYATADEIAQRIENEFSATYSRTIEAKGAILQLAENKISEKLLSNQLRHCLDTLVEIIRENELKVTGCEMIVEANLGINLPADSKRNNDMRGFIDMTLEDGDGHPVVIDFKWTGSKKYYTQMLKDNRSIQLELYRWMLSKTTKDTVERVAYFLMPEAKLYSKEEFQGDACTKIETENFDNIVEQLKISANYRINQIKNGMIENGGALENLHYANDTETLGLLPLKVDNLGLQEKNRFSNYQLFS